MSRPEMRMYLAYACTIFLGAFLLFAIQPMIGRTLLPLFGGSVSVWGTSLVFFTGFLFFGYAYVYVLHRFSIRLQVRVHLALLALSGLIVALSLAYTDSLYTFPAWIFAESVSPEFQVLLALILAIGIPYLALSTTSPLLQEWHGVLGTDREPYRLYALSNLGSLLALAAYPFVVEPLMRLSTQYALWSLLFLLYAAACGVITWRARGLHLAHSARADAAPVAWSVQAAWIFLAGLPAAMLVATTVYMTQTIAPVPFMWVIPLLLYLVSLILAFAGRMLYTGVLGVLPVFLTAWFVMELFGYSFKEARTELFVSALLMYFGSHYCHTHLYLLRPHARWLSRYYLAIALGGLLGTLFMSMLAPLVFEDFFEYLIGAALFAAVAVAGFPLSQYLRPEYIRHGRVIQVLAVLGIAYLVYAFPSNGSGLFTDRNFYGQIRIREVGNERRFSHGTTIHGAMFTTPGRELEPSTYYTVKSGISRAIKEVQRRKGDEPVSVGILGLGAGSMAAFCRPGDTYTFYELDPRVAEVAREYFRFLDSCEGVDIRFGDGRMLLEQELREGKKGDYDLLVIAAFSDDTVPTHLMTTEAVSLYLSHLRDDQSMLAFITSTRYVKLTQIALRIAEALGVPATYIYDEGSKEAPYEAYPSDWVLMARDASVFAAPSIKEAAWPLSLEGIPLWTDDYVNVFSVVSLPKWYFGEEEDEK